MKYVILGNTNNPITKTPDQPYSWFVKTFWQGLVLNGHTVKLIDYKTNSLEKIKNEIINFKPSAVFTHLTFHKFKDTEQVMDMFKYITNTIETKFVHTVGDARTHDRYMKDISHAFHLALVSNHVIKTNAEKCWNIPTFYCPYSSLTYTKMGAYQKNLDFGMPVFTGSDASHEDRKQFIQKLQKIMQIKIVRTQSGQDLRDHTLNLSASSPILGLCTGYDGIDGYMDVRPFQYLGTGALFIARAFPGTDSIIPRDIYFSFDGYENIDADKVKEYFNKISKMSDIEKHSMQLKSFNYIQQNHSSKIRMKEVINLLKEI